MTTDDDNKAGGDQIDARSSQGFINKPSGPVFQHFGPQIVQPLLAPALHQLRAPVGDFVGREREIGQLVQALTKTSSAAATITGVRGMGGIGKTELAHVVAQRLKDAFPDAQLLVELRGASSNPLTPEQAHQMVIFTNYSRQFALFADRNACSADFDMALAHDWAASQFRGPVLCSMGLRS